MLKIDGSTQIMGLIGKGLAHSKSPALHNRAAALLGFNTAYLPFSLPAEDLRDFLRLAWDMNALGFNVTTPHKAAVAALLGDSALDSVNTLFRGPSGWLGASTDGEGFAKGLARLGKDFDEFDHYVFLGSGGAVVALLNDLHLLSSRAKHIVVLRRSETNDLLLQQSLPADSTLELSPFSPEALREVLARLGSRTLLVQGTSAPIRGDDLKSFVPAITGFQGTLVDLVYGKPSALYFAALALDLEAQDGEAMLIEQARAAQRLWWGKAATYDDMAAVLRGK